MTTRAREVEAWLREERDRHEAMAAEAEATGHDVPLKFHGTAADKMGEFASALSALIAECETAKAELAEAVETIIGPLSNCESVTTYTGDGRFRAWFFSRCDAARAFIAKHTPPQPVPVGGEKGETT